MTIVRHTNEVLELYQSMKSAIITLWIFVVGGPSMGIWVLLVSRSMLGLFLGVLLLFPVFLLFTTSLSDTCTIDKHAQKIFFRKRGMLRSKVQEYWLHEVSGVDVASSSGNHFMVFFFTSGGKEQFGWSAEPKKVADTMLCVLTFLG